MSSSFDVRTAYIMVCGTPGAAEGYPLIHFPAGAGAVTLLEAFMTCTVAIPVAGGGDLNLFYGSLNAADGTIVPTATIGTSPGTCGALSEAAITLTASPCVIPANNWLGVNVATAFGTGKCPSAFTVSYITGR